jgi:3'(2'), 5'-bisphosphate nucleotidase
MIAVDVERLLGVLREAADLINTVYRGRFDVEYKAPGDPVTIADRRANELICTRLAELYPDVPVVAEESDAARYANYRSRPLVFFVDPVDGTREFVQRNGEFVTMLGVLAGERPAVGVILQPTTGDAGIGIVGEGAWRVSKDGQRSPIHVTSTDSLAGARLVASRSGNEDRYAAIQRRLGVAAITPLGSAGMKGLAVARGEAEAYVTPEYGGRRWDACPVEALVTAAGGRFSDAHGVPIDYRSESLANDRGLLASNGLIHDQLLELLAQRRARRSQENSPT